MLVLYLIVFVGMTGVGIIIPLFPFFGENVGATPAQITMLMALFAAGQFIAAPMWGWLSDRIGRKPVFILTLSGSVLSYLMLGLAETVSALFFARIIGGLMAGNIPVAFAAAADMSEGDERSKVIGRVGASFSLGFILGPAIGGVLAGGDPTTDDFLVVALAAGSMCFVALLVSLFAFKESHTIERRNNNPVNLSKDKLFIVFRYFSAPVLGILIITNFVFTAAGAILDSTFALYVNKAHALGPSAIGFVFAYMGVIMVFVQGAAIGPLTQRFGDILIARAGVISYLLGLVILIVAGEIVIVLLALTLVTTGIALFIPASSSIVSKHAPESEQGIVLGLFQAAGNLGRVITPMFSGIIFSSYGFTAPFYIALIILLPALWLIQKTKKIASA